MHLWPFCEPNTGNCRVWMKLIDLCRLQILVSPIASYTIQLYSVNSTLQTVLHKSSIIFLLSKLTIFLVFYWKIMNDTARLGRKRNNLHWQYASQLWSKQNNSFRATLFKVMKCKKLKNLWDTDWQNLIKFSECAHDMKACTFLFAQKNEKTNLAFQIIYVKIQQTLK